MKSASQIGSSIVMVLLCVTVHATPCFAQVRRSAAPSSEGFPRLDYDIGASAGSTTVNGETRQYQEAQLGLNLHLASWLVWRNSLFGRRTTQTEDVYGVDSGLRLQGGYDGDSLAVKLLAGGGYRFQNLGRGAPFAEAGLGIRLGALNLSGGAKRIFRKSVDAAAEDETQYFANVSGALRGQL